MVFSISLAMRYNSILKNLNFNWMYSERFSNVQAEWLQVFCSNLKTECELLIIKRGRIKPSTMFKIHNKSILSYLKYVTSGI